MMMKLFRAVALGCGIAASAGGAVFAKASNTSPRTAIEQAADSLRKGDSRESISAAYMDMAAAQYAKGQKAKAIMCSLLSLAYNFTDEGEAKALFYITGSRHSSLSLRGDKNDVIEGLLGEISKFSTPHQFKQYYAASSVVSLLPEFPFSDELLNQSQGEPEHICIGFDGNYSYHGAVTMLSAMLSANPSTRYVFHVPEDAGAKTPIPDHHREKLLSQLDFFPGSKHQLIFEKFGDDFLPASLCHREFRHWPRSILFKLYIPRFYSELDKILWLDSDLLVRSDLTPFYNEDLEGNWIMAVRDLAALEHLPRLKLEIDDAYVNAGVMLYDIKALQGKDQLVEDCIAAHGEEEDFLCLPEQDIYAVAYRGHIKENSFQYWTDRKFFYELGTWNWFYFPKHKKVTWDKLHTLYAKVIHMAANSRKPWNRKSSPMWWAIHPQSQDGVQNLYWTLRDMGPWPTR